MAFGAWNSHRARLIGSYISKRVFALLGPDADTGVVQSSICLNEIKLSPASDEATALYKLRPLVLIDICRRRRRRDPPESRRRPRSQSTANIVCGREWGSTGASLMIAQFGLRDECHGS